MLLSLLVLSPRACLCANPEFRARQFGTENMCFSHRGIPATNPHTQIVAMGRASRLKFGTVSTSVGNTMALATAPLGTPPPMPS